MSLYKTCRSATVVLAILFFTVACSGGGGGGGDTGTNGGTASLNIDQQAFADTLYPILDSNCSSCHSEQGDPGIDLAKIAHSDPAIAYAVLINRDFVDRDNPQLSRVVERLVTDRHYCWTNCAADGVTVTNAIARWNDLAANKSGGGGATEVAPKASVDAFVDSVYPVVTQWCSGCHDGGTANLSAFASPDTETAHEVILNRSLVDLGNPANSQLVSYLADKEHNCWSDCVSNAARMEDAVVQWQQALAAADTGNGNNRLPIAVNDLYSTLADVPVTTGNVLLNDSDADNDTLSISAFGAVSGRGGNVVNNLDGTFTYTPPSGFTGSDTFNYTISDGQGGTDNATVTIAVEANNGPVAIDDKVQANQNAAVIISNLLANDRSGNGNTLSIIAVDNVSQKGGRVQLDNASSVTYNPPTGATGLDRFTYTISDGIATASAQVEVDINAQPVAVSDAVYTYVDITANTSSVLENDRDTNGDTLTISSFDTSSVQAGSVSYNGDGTFTYEPPAGFEGNDSFDYIVSDGRGGTATATVNIAVTQQALRDDNRFLAFLNQTSPLHDEDVDSARAYYAAVDPTNRRTTLEAWRTVNGFNIGADAAAVYINANDLGFSRRMFVRTDPITGVVSSYVENYPTLQDALNQTNLIATVAMEYTVAPGQDPQDPDAHRYTTFYVFGANGNRDLGADLDGRGFKFVPGLCNTCHGGRPKALVDGVYPDAGDTGAGHIPWDLDTYLFADNTASVSRADQEDQFKIFNQTVLRTNPTAAQRELIEGWYGGSSLPANTFNGGFVPDGWRPPAAPDNATQLYLQVVARSCRACHVQRGSEQQSDIDFASYEKFISYKPRIEKLVFDESTMPLARQTFGRFWENVNIPETLAVYLDSPKLLENNELLTPGRSIANAGPFREAALGRVDLNGNGSLFTGGGIAFNWTLVSKPAQSLAVLRNANQPNAFFDADVPGDYIVQLVVNDGIANTPPSPPAEVVIRVSPAARPVSFVSDVAPVFDQCAVCHLGFDNPRFNNLGTLYDNVINFVNLDDPINSRILTKPSGHHHNGGTIAGFETPTSEKYSLILRWILEGARDN